MTAPDVQALVIADHNLTSAAVITLQGNDDASNWVSPKVQESVTWRAGTICHYLGDHEQCRYWRVQISDADNPDGYIRAALLYLGPYFEPARNFSWGYSADTESVIGRAQSDLGLARTRFYNWIRKWKLTLEAQTDTDVEAMRDLMDNLGTRDDGRLRPLFMHLDADQADQAYWVELLDLPAKHERSGRTTVTLDLAEIPSNA